MLRLGLRPGLATIPLSGITCVRWQSTGKPIGADNVSESSHTHSHVSQHSHSHSHSHGHGHHHSHSAENVALLTQGNGLRDPRVRITWIGLLANVCMALGKGVGGVVFHSQSLIADAIHAVTDMVSDFLTLATVSVAKKPPTEYFPNGYGRIEAIGAFGVSSLLLAAGASMGFGSLVTTLDVLGMLPTWLESAQEHAHVHGQLADWNAAWIAMASIVIKESLFQATYRIGTRTNSRVLIANAWHHRVDCLASGVAVISIAGGQLFNAAWLDPMGGLIVSAMILRAGWGPTRDSVLEIAGSTKSAMTSDKYDEIMDRARTELSTIDSSYAIDDLMLEPYGSTYIVTIRLFGVKEGAEQVAAKLRDALLQIDHVKAVRVTI